MTPKQRELRTREIIEFLKSTGWEEDRYGNYTKFNTTSGGKYRIKFQSISLRYESQCQHADGSKSWVKIRGGYVKDIKIVEGKLTGWSK